jgi:hypothetical protein
MKTSTARGTRKLPKEQAYDRLLSPNGPFAQAVQRSSVEDAAHAAVNILMVRLRLSRGQVRVSGAVGHLQAAGSTLCACVQEIVGNLARTSTSGGASASSMLSALISVGDEVILKSENVGSGSLVGTVTESIVSKGSARPVYRVRYASLM